jgi:Leishmanolysin
VLNGFLRLRVKSDARLKGMQTLFTRIGAISITVLALAACGQNPGVTPPPPPPAGNFNITLQFGSSIQPNVRSAFTSAASKWEQVLIGDLGNVNATVDPADCGVTGFQSVSSVDDVIIFADVQPIDGKGGTLAQAGPCLVRQNSSSEPISSISGAMVFDSADIDDLAKAGQLTETVRHEMGHVLGFGTFWKFRPGLLVNGGASGACGATPTYAGSGAVGQYATLGGSGDVPVEGSADGSGPGTCDSHWRETTFKTELMTGYLDPNVANPFSKMSIAAMQDLGYQVNFNAAEGYNLAAIGNTLPLSKRIELREKLITPRFALVGTQKIPLR